MNPPTLLRRPPPPPSSFTFLPPPQNPNPNPNLNLSPFASNLNYHPHPSSSTTPPQPPLPPPPPPPPPDLPTTLSTLKTLIRHSQSTLHSLSSLLPTSSSPTSLIPCPSNPHHRLPPPSLFLHSLHCPYPILPNIDLSSLQYPTTLQSASNHNTTFNQTSDLFLSLDEYCDFGPGFFYADCPGVVASHDNPGRTFTLPGILSAECANYVIGRGENIIEAFDRDWASSSLWLLPSELWLVRSEIEAWSDYPVTYSYCVVRAIVLRSMEGEGCGFMRWVTVNSPRYGVVIDEPMRDHVVLLLRLCLRAIVREATGFVNLVLKRDTMETNPVGTIFKCPVLVDVLKWLSFQLSVLYGEVNGKFFAVNMLKQWLLSASLNSSLFPLEQKSPGSPALRDANGESGDSFDKSVKDDGNRMLGESLYSKVIFVSQVAAAVAALHEQSLLEQKIKVLRGGHRLTNYQWTAEHVSFSKWADEERQKRSNYRPLVDHDSLSWQQRHNQDMNKRKSREELLAEERDYRRRRMSYRGKKLKRSTTQVMRDIIDKYMDDITQAGGIGCLLKGADEAGKSISEPPLLHDISMDVVGRSNSVYNSSEITREGPYSYKEQLHSPIITRSSRFENKSPEDHRRYRRDSSRNHEHLEARRSVGRDRHHSREYNSKAPDRQRNNNHSHDHHNNSGYRDSYSRSRERTGHPREEGDRYSDKKDRRQGHAFRDRRSNSVASNEFDDRYDPSESCNTYDDDISVGSGNSQK